MMTKEEAIGIVEKALNAATTKGVYDMSAVSLIIQALNKINELVEIIEN